MSSSMAMGVIEAALFSWVKSGSGLADTNILWAAQNAPRPAANPWISMRITSIRAMGIDWIDATNNPSPTAGAEVLMNVRGVRRCTFSLQCFAAIGTGASGPAAILNDVLTACTLPSVSDALDVAFVGVSDFGDIKTIDGVVNSTKFEPRAMVEIIFYAKAELVETATYIEHVQIQNLTTGESFTV